MKTLIFVIILIGNLSLRAGSFGLEGETFQVATNTEVIWNAPTNNLPRNLWIYKVLPEAIPAAVVSNAMKLCHFTMKDLSKGESYP